MTLDTLHSWHRPNVRPPAFLFPLVLLEPVKHLAWNDLGQASQSRSASLKWHSQQNLTINGSKDPTWPDLGILIQNSDSTSDSEPSLGDGNASGGFFLWTRRFSDIVGTYKIQETPLQLPNQTMRTNIRNNVKYKYWVLLFVIYSPCPLSDNNPYR